MSAVPLKTCADCERLYSQYEAGTREYLRTVEVLHRRGPQFPPSLYDEVRLAAENARLRAEAARISMDLHVATHLQSEGDAQAAAAG